MRTTVSASIFCFFVICSSPSSAENWKPISDDGQGNRIVADADSYVFDYVDGKAVADVHLKIIPGDKYFAARIYVDECVNKHQGTLIWHYDGASTHTEYFWDQSGDYMYDYVGRALCAATIAVVHQPRSTHAN